LEYSKALAYNKFLPEYLIKKLALDKAEVREALAFTALPAAMRYILKSKSYARKGARRINCIA
jgi:hypothetical protein